MNYLTEIKGQLSGRRSWHWTNWVIIGSILLFFFLASATLDSQSLWRDEALTVGRIQQPIKQVFANRNIVQGVDSPDLHPPLYFLLLKLWSMLSGLSEFALRYFSLLAIVLSLALFSAVGGRIWNRETGVWAAVLAAVSSFYLWYAQEARMYTMMVMLTLLFLYTLWPLLTGQAKARDYLLCGLVAFLLIYTHYTGVFLVGFAAIALVVSRLNIQQLKWSILLLVGLMLLFIPLATSVRELVESSGFLAFEQRPLWDLLREAVNTFTMGSAIPLPEPGWRMAPFALLAILGIPALAVAHNRYRKQAVLIGFGGFLITLLLFYLASFLQANYSNPRHLTILSPILILLIAQGLTALRRVFPPAAFAAAAIILSLSSLSLWQTINDPLVVRDDVRGLADYIEDRALPGDLIVWHDAVMMQTYNYYTSDIPYTAVPRYGQGSVEESLKQVADLARESDRIWFVEKPAPAYFDEEAIPTWFDKNMMAVDRSIFPASWASLDLKLYKEQEIIESLPPEAAMAEVDLNPIEIIGWSRIASDAGEAGVWLTIYWRQEGTQDTESRDFCLSLRDSADITWTKGCSLLENPAGGSTSNGAIYTQEVWLPLPAGLAPISYRLLLERSDLAADLGQLNLASHMITEAGNPAVTFENGISFMDISWADEDFRAGLWAIGYPQWQRNELIEGPVSARYRLVNLLGRTIAEAEEPLGPPDYPVSDWPPETTIRDFMGLALPFESGGWYRLQVGLLDENGTPIAIDAIGPARYWANAGWIYVSPWPFTNSLPEEAEQLDPLVIFGDHIRLRGYQLSRSGDELVVDLYWQSDESIAKDWGSFLHIANPGEEPAVQSSGIPAQGTRPTSTWREDEVIRDRHTLILPPQIDLTNLAILVGFYDLQDPNSRLPVVVDGVPSSDDSFLLSTLEGIDP